MKITQKLSGSRLSFSSQAATSQNIKTQMYFSCTVLLKDHSLFSFSEIIEKSSSTKPYTSDVNKSFWVIALRIVLFITFLKL